VNLVLTSRYQVWSTALGGFLTEATYTGAKAKTNVYAGGSVLAEQNVVGSSSSVSWIHADPVTGSSTRVNKDGATWYRTEYEPLGQEINPFGEEEEYSTPQNGFSTFHDASDSQWQCDMAENMNTSFYNLPAACQVAAMQLPDEVIFTWYEKGDPVKVNEATLGMLTNYNSSASDGVLAYAKSATNKPPKKKKEEKKEKKENGCDDTEVGTNGQCHVEVPAPMIDMSETGGTDARQNTVKNLFYQALDDAWLALEKGPCADLFGTDPEGKKIQAQSFLTRYTDYPNSHFGTLSLGDLGAYRETKNADGTTTSSGTGANAIPINPVYIAGKDLPKFSNWGGVDIIANSNPNGPFVAGARDFLRVGASDRTYRALFIIHELAHAIQTLYQQGGVIPSSVVPGFVNDGPSVTDAGMKSKNNSQLVYDACFK
jgi:hypothetical protein